MAQPYAIPTTDSRSQAQSIFFTKVFSWMAIGLGITGVLAFVVANAGIRPSNSLLMILTFAQLGMVLGISFGINRISAAVATGLFLGYSALMGIWLSYVFVYYSLGTVAAAFFVTGGMFFAMALIGWTTKRDLTGFGGFLMMALIGLVIASVVGIFWNFPGRMFIVMYVGLFIFLGLTIYQVWALKRGAEGAIAAGGEFEQKAAIMGALALYINFINIFIRILSLFGSNR